MRRKLFLNLIFFIIVFLLLQLPAGLAQDFPDVCQQPDNILPNCNFNNGLDRWQPFTETGSANVTVLQGGGECHAPLCPAAYMVTQSHFVGGLYQQVPAQAGNTYYANMVWLTFDALVNDASINKVVGGIGRRIGIDPLGGTDSRSPNIVWGPDNWRNDCKICDNQAVTATAQADTITVFVRIEDTWRLRAAEKGYPIPPSKDQFWLDDVGLKQVAGGAAPAANPTQPPPTDTPSPAPPTPTSVVESPTNTPELAVDIPISPTTTSTEIAQGDSLPAQPVSPVQTPTSAGVAPPPTLTPTNTPSPTATVERPSPVPTRAHLPTPSASSSSTLNLEWLGLAGTTICAGGIILAIMAVVLVGLVWLYRLGWGTVEDEDEESDEDTDDDDDSIVAEIVEE